MFSCTTMPKVSEEDLALQGMEVNSIREIINLIDAGDIERSKVIIQVFEASALNTQILKGLDSQLINNFDDLLESTDRFPGLKVGSMTEASTDGNWE